MTMTDKFEKAMAKIGKPVDEPPGRQSRRRDGETSVVATSETMGLSPMSDRFEAALNKIKMQFEKNDTH